MQTTGFKLRISGFGSGRSIHNHGKLLLTEIPLLSDEQFPDEVFSELGRLREELLVELVVAGDDVGIRLLLGVAQER